MGVASSDTIELIRKRNLEQIEEIKKNINESIQKNPDDCITIIFNLMNGRKISVPCFQNNKLYDIFLLLVDKAKDSYYANLDKLKLYYNSIDITDKFIKEKNNEVSCLNVLTYTPMIHVNI